MTRVSSSDQQQQQDQGPGLQGANIFKKTFGEEFLFEDLINFQTASHKVYISALDSQGESSSEHSLQEEGGDVPGGVVEVLGHDKEDLLVCRL